ncbi:MAG: tRNA preQ1(34) S-adenosylmethionine ribosyltransferase-isomerase QueA [Gemmatimonadota bacterium]|nr:MAG: tRNA preQ1(34) S-adenosylmethionine ribosyltransferase-isomerase QueA [Gemmatimonadota bacterium]
MSTGDFEYPLEERLIAQYPLPERDASRLLLVRRQDGSLADHGFKDLTSLVSPGDVLVLNDTRVFPARLTGHKPSGAAAELLLIERLDVAGASWRALVRPAGKLKPGRVVQVAPDLRVVIGESLAGGARLVHLDTPLPPDEAIARFGRVPLPPYIRRQDDESDRGRYQTIYARDSGSVAAPTAGLHFSDEMLAALRARRVDIAMVTLHVGPGTFRPVEVEDPAQHQVEAEWYRVTPAAAETINEGRARGGAIWAVGTTTVRTLETVVGEDGRIRSGEGTTDLFIRQGHRFAVVDRLVTNFHLPRSTLLMLVAAFAGYDLTMAAYRHAIGTGYRFYSYGDSMAVL